MKKSIIITAALMAAAVTASAQFRKGTDLDTAAYFRVHSGHYITLQAGYGIQTIDHDLNMETGDLKNGFGPAIKFGYRWYLTKNLGIGTGLFYQQFQSDSRLQFQDTLGTSTDNYYAEGEVGEVTPIVYFDRNFTERAQTQTVSIPAMIYWHQNLNNFWKIGLGAGAMYSISISDKYEITDGYIQPHYYFPSVGLNYYGHHGTEEIGSGFNSAYNFRQTISANAEVEVIYSINPRFDLTAALYATYGVTHLKAKSDNILYEPDWKANPAEFPEAWAQKPKASLYSGVLNSRMTENPVLMSAGLMLGLRCRLGHDAKMQLDQYEQDRSRRKVTDFDIIHQTKLTDDGRVKRKFHDEEENVDSTLLAEEEMRRRRIHDEEIQRKKRMQDSLENLMKNNVDTATPVVVVEETKPAQPDPVKPPVVDDGSWETELNDIIKRANNNTCAFNESATNANRKQLKDVDRLAEIMKAHPDVKLILIGHTCDIGTEEQNKVVGMRRAQKYAQDLVDRGIDRSRLQCETKWFSEPLVPNTSEANRKINRRVQIKKQ